eukprot:m.308414 g.308414  ORF g.308414 m.308414 type:complete len:344 (+) comp19632_c1_seq1:83-1114(+)
MAHGDDSIDLTCVGEGETAAQMFARSQAVSSLGSLELPLVGGEHGLAVGDVVEFYGQEGSGKSELLLHCIVHCILPQTHASATVSATPLGAGVGVLVIDTDYRFSLERLVTVMERRLDDRGIDEESASDIITESLGRLFVSRCNSQSELIVTLQGVPELLAMHTLVQVLAIDSISAFYYLERAACGDKYDAAAASFCKAQRRGMLRDLCLVIDTCHQHPLIEAQQTNAFILNFPVPGAVVTCLRELLGEHPLVVLVSKLALFGGGTGGSSRDLFGHHDFLPREWDRLVTRRVVVASSPGHTTATSPLGELHTLRGLKLVKPAKLRATASFRITEGGCVFDHRP